jgi:two-component system, sporulation sensor kinase E
MPATKSNFLEKVLGRLGRLDQEGLQTLVARLAQERDLLETLFNTIEDGVLVVDEAGRIVYFNRAVTRLLGLQPQNAEGQPVSRYLPELDWTKLAAWDGAAGQPLVRHELEVTFPRPRILSLYATPLDRQAGGATGLALVLHDITQDRQQTAAAIENERTHALTVLAASVAHEIGNPLNALHIHLQLMERELRKLKLELAEAVAPPAAQAHAGASPATAPGLDRAEKLEKYLGVAKGEIARLDYIVTEFLQALRPSPPQFQQAQVNDVVQATLDLLRPEIDNRGLTVRQKLGRQLPACRIDPAQIKQALVNLIKNAIQAMSRGGVLTVTTEAGEDGVWVTVADTGRGIAPEDIPRLFEPFYTTKKKGSGLGLLIVQRIIRDHNGRIAVQSHPGRGTTFRIWLPAHERPPRLIEAHPETQSAP